MANSLSRSNSNISFIGGGNMATSLIGALISNKFPNKQINVLDRNQEKRSFLSNTYDINTFDNLVKTITNTDIIFLAVKPNQVKELAIEINKLTSNKYPLIVSIAAGIDTTQLENWLSSNFPIVRAMPNTPAMYQVGATGLYATMQVSEKQKSIVSELFNSIGLAIWLKNEIQLDIVTGLSGSGPAYFFKICECFISSASKLGLDKETAKLLTLQTMHGAAIISKESTESLETLRNNVTSKGGTTEAGLNVLLKNDIEKILFETLEAATNKAAELRKKQME